MAVRSYARLNSLIPLELKTLSGPDFEIIRQFYLESRERPVPLVLRSAPVRKWPDRNVALQSPLTADDQRGFVFIHFMGS